METLTKSEVEYRKNELMKKMDEGDVFIHPTDTIYGLGCNALDEKAISHLRKLKDRPDTPFSVWAPSKDWIREHCEVSEEGEEWLDKLPGPYTLVLKLKNKKAISPNVNPGNGTIGIRIPNHWFNSMVEEFGLPIVTTSANRAGHSFMTSIENIDPEIKKGIRFAIYEGEKKGRPSQIVDLAGGKASMKDR